MYQKQCCEDLRPRHESGMILEHKFFANRPLATSTGKLEGRIHLAFRRTALSLYRATSISGSNMMTMRVKPTLSPVALTGLRSVAYNGGYTGKPWL